MTDNMKDLGQLFITISVTAAWCAMWFIVIMNEGMMFPELLHGAFLGVLAWNGYTIYQGIKIAKQELALRLLQAKFGIDGSAK